MYVRGLAKKLYQSLESLRNEIKILMSDSEAIFGGWNSSKISSFTKIDFKNYHLMDFFVTPQFPQPSLNLIFENFEIIFHYK